MQSFISIRPKFMWSKISNLYRNNLIFLIGKVEKNFPSTELLLDKTEAGKREKTLKFGEEGILTLLCLNFAVSLKLYLNKKACIEQTKEDDLPKVNGVPHCMESTNGYGK